MEQQPQAQENTSNAYILENPIALLGSAFSLYWDKLSVLMPIAFIVFIIGLIQIFSVQSGILSLGIVSSIAGVLVAYVSYIAIIRAVSSPALMHIGEVFVSIERTIIPTAWVSGLMVLMVLGGTLLLVIPGIIVLVYTTFAVFAVIIDHYEKRNALVFSWHLVRDRWWGVFLRFVIANVTISIAAGIIISLFWLLGVGETPAQTILRIQEEQYAIPISQLILNQIINNFFTMPITLCFAYVFYEALKRTVVRPLESQERAEINWYVRTLAIIGISLLIVAIFASSYIIARFLPEFVRATHMPAAAFSIF